MPSSAPGRDRGTGFGMTRGDHAALPWASGPAGMAGLCSANGD